MYRAKHLKYGTRKRHSTSNIYKEDFLGAAISVKDETVVITRPTKNNFVQSVSKDYGVTWTDNGEEWPFTIYEAVRRAVG